MVCCRTALLGLALRIALGMKGVTGGCSFRMKSVINPHICCYFPKPASITPWQLVVSGCSFSPFFPPCIHFLPCVHCACWKLLKRISQHTQSVHHVFNFLYQISTTIICFKLIQKISINSYDWYDTVFSKWLFEAVGKAVACILAVCNKMRLSAQCFSEDKHKAV